MMDAQELLALAERVEGLSGPDRDCDGWIYVLLNPDNQTVVDHEPGRFPRKAIMGPISRIMKEIGGSDGADYISAPHYTASLDAARTLAPSGWAICTGHNTDGEEADFTTLLTRSAPDDESEEVVEASSDSWPASIVAAALRATAKDTGNVG